MLPMMVLKYPLDMMLSQHTGYGYAFEWKQRADTWIWRSWFWIRVQSSCLYTSSICQIANLVIVIVVKALDVDTSTFEIVF